METRPFEWCMSYWKWEYSIAMLVYFSGGWSKKEFATNLLASDGATLLARQKSSCKRKQKWLYTPNVRRNPRNFWKSGNDCRIMQVPKVAKLFPIEGGRSKLCARCRSAGTRKHINVPRVHSFCIGVLGHLESWNREGRVPLDGF